MQSINFNMLWLLSTFLLCLQTTEGFSTKDSDQSAVSPLVNPLNPSCTILWITFHSSTMDSNCSVVSWVQIARTDPILSVSPPAKDLSGCHISCHSFVELCCNWIQVPSHFQTKVKCVCLYHTVFFNWAKQLLCTYLSSPRLWQYAYTIINTTHWIVTHCICIQDVLCSSSGIFMM